MLASFKKQCSLRFLFHGLLLATCLTGGNAFATVYSDAESGNDGWSVFDNTPAGASVSVVNDSTLGSRVIRTAGSGRENGYLLGGRDASTGWNNSDEPVLEWKMATNEAFVVQAYVLTRSGPRRLTYTQSNSDSGKNPSNDTIAFGLTSAANDGTWRTHRRDLANDVSQGEPGNSLLSVYGLVVLGNARLDDVALLEQGAVVPAQDSPPVAALSLDVSGGVAPLVVTADASGSSDDSSISNFQFSVAGEISDNRTSSRARFTFDDAGVYTVSVTVTDSSGQSASTSRQVTVTAPGSTLYSDAESGVDGWVVFDNTPGGARITSVLDNALQSRVINLQGSGRNNGYLLGGVNSSTGWNNRTESSLSWDMNTSEAYELQVYVETSLGIRRLTYSQSNTDGLRNPSNNTISFGLTSDSVGSGWQSYQRDLAADLARGEPGNTLVSVNGLVVLGSLRLDNIVLGSGNAPPAISPPDADFNVTSSSGTAPLSVTFTAAPSSAQSPAVLIQYQWDFDNGNTADTADASTTYTQPGSYSVTLTVTDSNGLSDSATRTVTVQGRDAPTPLPQGDSDANEAARLLAQATFGATLSDIAEVQRLGIEGWVDNQFTRQGSTSHLEFSQNFPGSASLSGPRQNKWLIDAIDGDDQLRQRVAFAYSEIFVTSDVSQTLEREQYAMSNYYDILLNSAFGNYRDLIEDITLSPVMGLYLSMLQNAQAVPENNTRADENFAREIMQLFSIGLHELNNNGTERLAGGKPIPAYTQDNVEEYARVFTGWTYADAIRFDQVPAAGNTNKLLPMRPFGGFHDTGRKTLLRGVVSPAGISAEEDLAIALDSLFNHPNVGPFIGKQLIQRLVTSNPTPAYVGRVANAFNDNGSNVRGDMRAVIRAILLDPEARNGHNTVEHFGKLREPLIRWTHLWRAFNVQRGNNSQNNYYNHSSPDISLGGAFLGQAVLSANSVFNFFHPDYAPVGNLREEDLVAPESEIYSDAFILSTTSRFSELSQRFFQGADDNSLNSSFIDISDETRLASNPGQLLNRLDLLLMSGQMSAELRSILLDHMNDLPNDEAGRSQRVRDGITLIMASAEYLVQK